MVINMIDYKTDIERVYKKIDTIEYNIINITNELSELKNDIKWIKTLKLPIYFISAIITFLTIFTITLQIIKK
jgi:hypothetical protein